MKTICPEAFTPRKTPRQARSQATVEAIFEATIQVLLTAGSRRLTTTRVAERAGVSVGTMYQYFPNKHSLLYAVLKRYLEMVAATVEAVCGQNQGQGVTVMAEALVTAYIDAKTSSPGTSRALYLVGNELDTAGLLDTISKRISEAVTAMLASAKDAKFEDLPAVTFTLLAVMSGATRILFERGAAPSLIQTLRDQLAVMCRTYLQAAARNTAPLLA